jgi:RNA-directed DNA polymerase
MTEKSESPWKVAGGTGEVPGRVRQAITAKSGQTSSKAEKLMDKVMERANLIRAYKRVKANKGAPGVDGITVDELGPYLKAHWPRLREGLRTGVYEPTSILAVDIDKHGGGTRRLGIPTVVDRFIQQAILQVLSPIFDATFSEASYGYRSGRSAQQAVEAGRQHVEAGFRWVVDLDIEKFFDRVNHDILMSRVAKRIGDKVLLKLLRRYLEAGMMVNGVVLPREEGTPQGGPLSPLLSNILLDELDKELERRGHRHCRYADDCNVYVRSRKAGERVMQSLEEFLAKRLRLKVNRHKSQVARPWKRKFLGYSMTFEKKPRLTVAPESIIRAKGDLRQLCREGRGRSLAKVIEDVNRFTRGWLQHYRLAQTTGVFEEFDVWIRRRLRCLLWRQWKQPHTRAKKMIKLGLEKERAWKSAMNGRGAWWNAGASHMNASITTAWLTAQGLQTLENQRRCFAVS